MGFVKTDKPMMILSKGKPQPIKPIKTEYDKDNGKTKIVEYEVISHTET